MVGSGDQSDDLCARGEGSPFYLVEEGVHHLGDVDPVQAEAVAGFEVVDEAVEFGGLLCVAAEVVVAVEGPVAGAGADGEGLQVDDLLFEVLAALDYRDPNSSLATGQAGCDACDGPAGADCAEDHVEWILQLGREFCAPEDCLSVAAALGQEVEVAELLVKGLDDFLARVGAVGSAVQ